MPVYINGRKGASEKVRGVNIAARIEQLLRDNGGNIGDIRRFQEEELIYVRKAMRAFANDVVSSIIIKDPLAGICIDKVVDVSTFPLPQNMEFPDV